MITFGIILYAGIALALAFILRVITSTWRHSGVVLIWPVHAVLGTLTFLGHALVLIGEQSLAHATRASGALTRWLP